MRRVFNPVLWLVVALPVITVIAIVVTILIAGQQPLKPVASVDRWGRVTDTPAENP